jgi:hypothetical protein
MNDSIREKHARQVAINNAAVSQTMAEIYQAQANGDQETEDTAITTLAALRTQRREIDAMAVEALTPRAPAHSSVTPGQDSNLSRADAELCQRYGVDPHTLEIGTCWTQDPTLTKAQKFEIWARNSQRHQAELAAGKRDERHQQRGY